MEPLSLMAIALIAIGKSLNKKKHTSSSSYSSTNSKSADTNSVCSSIGSKTKENRMSQSNMKLMAYYITDSCVECGTCLPECPVEAISEGCPYQIDPDLCIDCGTCSSVCPTDAIIEGQDLDIQSLSKPKPKERRMSQPDILPNEKNKFKI